MDYSIDKESILKNQLKEAGSICTGPFDANSWAYNPKVKPTPYNTAMARELLSQAGWSDTDGDGILEVTDKLGWDLPHFELRKVPQTRGVYPIEWED
jgi:peptide/nickel transport system substrate-binding protein